MQASNDFVMINAATTVLRVLRSLRDPDWQGPVHVALARAMPLIPVDDPEYSGILEAPARLAALIATLRELRAEAHTLDQDAEIADHNVREALNLAAFMADRLTQNSDWIRGKISGEMIMVFRNMEASLPRDRLEVDQTELGSLITALAELRALMNSPDTDPVVVAELKKIVEALDAAVVASYLKGAAPLKSLLFHWQGMHARERRGRDSAKKTNDAPIAETLGRIEDNLLNIARRKADDALRLTGAWEIAKNLLGLDG